MITGYCMEVSNHYLVRLKWMSHCTLTNLNLHKNYLSTILWGIVTRFLIPKSKTIIVTTDAHWNVRYCSIYFPAWINLSIANMLEIGTLYFFFSKRDKKKYRGAEQIVKSHAAGKGHSQDLNTGDLIQEVLCLSIIPTCLPQRNHSQVASRSSHWDFRHICSL